MFGIFQFISSALPAALGALAAFVVMTAYDSLIDDPAVRRAAVAQERAIQNEARVALMRQREAERQAAEARIADAERRYLEAKQDGALLSARLEEAMKEDADEAVAAPVNSCQPYISRRLRDVLSDIRAGSSDPRPRP
jgi:coenzyme F420-reducing hydrogenase beta subunit